MDWNDDFSSSFCHFLDDEHTHVRHVQAHKDPHENCVDSGLGYVFASALFFLLLEFYLDSCGADDDPVGLGAFVLRSI